MKQNRIIHIYANAQGLAGETGLYVPHGFQYVDGPYGAYENMEFKGPGNLTIVFVHVAAARINRRDTNAYGYRIGNIGGPGGNSPAAGKLSYVHTHIAFFATDTRVSRNGKVGTRVDPRDYFCPGWAN